LRWDLAGSNWLKLAQTEILLISTLGIGRITGVSHGHLAFFYFLDIALVGV
jgi:hypothetical protein